MRVFNIDDIAPLDIKHISGRFWITYDPSHNDNCEIEKGAVINYNGKLYQVEYDVEYEDGFTSICTPYHPESFPLEFVESLGVDDVVSKYVEWIKSNP